MPLGRTALHRLVAAMLVLAGASAAASPQLATQAGCAVCHAADKRLLGSSWKEVAARYKGQADAPARLAAVVRKGGQGTWGKVPMAPVDSTKVSDADLKTLLAWVLKTP